MIKENLIKIVDKIHFRLMNEKIGSVMENFLKNLSYVTFSTIAVAALTMIIQIVAGRYMGPDEYGRFSIALSIGSILSTITLVGLHISSVYYISKGERKSQYMSAGLFGTFINTLIMAIIWFSFLSFWSKLSNTTYSVAVWSGIFMIFNAFYQITRSFLRGLDKMKQFAIFDIVSALVAVLIFIPLIIFSNSKDFSIAVFSRTILLFIFASLSLFLIIPKIKVFSKKEISNIYSYGFFGFAGGIGNMVLGNADRLMLNYYKGSHEAGLYYAYFIASQAVLFQLFQSFLLIFFPAATQSQDKKGLVKKINSLFIKLSPAILIFNIITTAVIVFLFGKSYGFDLFYIFIFSLSSFFYTVYQTYGWLLNTVGKKGAKNNALFIVGSALFFIAISLYIIPKWGIVGTISSLTITYFILTIIMIKITNNHLQKAD